MLPVASILNKPVLELTADFLDIIVENGVPIFVKKGAEHFQPLFQKLHLDDIVEEQVSSFSVSRLEEMVVSITKKELSMIIYLGACLVESSVYFKVS
ncbi:hypothetical protein AB9M92_03615 [Peribacillus frigoritolerans]|uniref:hypothetical protein n=1 Tax=Peribacillus frigoritolerans TaxID=450367 RepID=UPI0035134469